MHSSERNTDLAQAAFESSKLRHSYVGPKTLLGRGIMLNRCFWKTVVRVERFRHQHHGRFRPAASERAGKRPLQQESW